MIPFLPFFMMLSLAASAWADSVLRVNHALASYGAVELVICGMDGAETIVMDRDGNRIDDPGVNCDHCADCMVPPMASLPETAGAALPCNLLPVRHDASVALGVAQCVLRSRARGPPARTEI
jgi:hypothetical protein